jgi:hypothetical protein
MKGFVSRSEFQRLAEKNKKLTRDLRIICTGSITQAFQKRIEYRKQFQQDKELEKTLKKVAVDYFKEHPELKLTGHE